MDIRVGYGAELSSPASRGFENADSVTRREHRFTPQGGADRTETVGMKLKQLCVHTELMESPPRAATVKQRVGIGDSRPSSGGKVGIVDTCPHPRASVLVKHTAHGGGAQGMTPQRAALPGPAAGDLRALGGGCRPQACCGPGPGSGGNGTVRHLLFVTSESVSVSERAGLSGRSGFVLTLWSDFTLSEY